MGPNILEFSHALFYYRVWSGLNKNTFEVKPAKNRSCGHWTDLHYGHETLEWPTRIKAMWYAKEYSAYSFSKWYTEVPEANIRHTNTCK